MTVKMYMVIYYISLHGFINYAEQRCMVDLTGPFQAVMLITYVSIALIGDMFGIWSGHLAHA